MSKPSKYRDMSKPGKYRDMEICLKPCASLALCLKSRKLKTHVCLKSAKFRDMSKTREVLRYV